ncbi:MAG: DUF4248 domain-containing protein [Paludibacteraceae bacterium]|nr:DUF4248 domain-containing protein [Paludibacteraceae bacterium]
MIQKLEYKSMSKKEFANMVGISVRTLNRWIKRIEKDLYGIGYDKNSHILSPKIVEFLCMKFVVLQEKE